MWQQNSEWNINYSSALGISGFNYANKKYEFATSAKDLLKIYNIFAPSYLKLTFPFHLDKAMQNVFTLKIGKNHTLSQK